MATRNPAVEQTRLLQVLDEERQLAERRERRIGIPVNIDTARVRIDGNRLGNGWLNRRSFADRVS